MKSNKIMYIIIGVCVILVIGFCTFLILNKKEVVLSDAEKFKQEFESYNGANYSGGYDGELIEVSIPEDNPFVYKTPKEIVDIMHNEDCYVLFGYATDPLMRNAIEVLIEALNERNITKVYYVDIEDIRDEYTISFPSEKTKEGSEAYYDILAFFGDNLEEYLVYDSENNFYYDTGTTRMYSPTFAAIKDYDVVSMHELTVDTQEDIYRELTNEEKEVLKEYYLEVIDSMNTDSSEN